MRAAARLLEAAADAPAPAPVDSDLVIILASLLCALICVVGLALVARCAWLRRAPQPQAPPTKGLKRSELRALPKVPYEGSIEGKLVDCVICLAEFAEGDEVRVLPQCGHGFHALCVDRWLASHSSCPSCRRTPVLAPPPSRCRRCGGTSEPGAAASASSAEGGAKARQDGAANSSLP